MERKPKKPKKSKLACADKKLDKLASNDTYQKKVKTSLQNH